MDTIRTFFANKTAVYGVVAALLIAVALYYYLSSKPSSPVSLTATQAPSATAGQTLIIALSNLQNVKLDSKVFNDPVFRSLTDFGVTIQAQPVGRINPFAPLSGQTATQGGVVLPATIKTR